MNGIATPPLTPRLILMPLPHHQINEANILLPYTQVDRGVQYLLTLSSKTHCFHWTASNPEYAAVWPLPPRPCQEEGAIYYHNQKQPQATPAIPN